MKKGFTLIELLAVLIILALIISITTPLILNTLKNSQKQTKLQNSKQYLSAVKVALTNTEFTDIKVSDGAYKIMENGNICLGKLTGNVCDNDILNIDVKGETPTSGTIVIEHNKIKNHILTYNSNVTIGNGKIGKVCILTSDIDKDDIADIGDMITCISESFYVIDTDEETITMLSQYNLDVGNKYETQSKTKTPLQNPTGIQKEEAKGYIKGTTIRYGVVQFSTSKYWNSVVSIKNSFLYGDYKDSNDNYLNSIYPFVEEYKKYLVKNGVKSAQATLISKEQVDVLDRTINPRWLYDTTYWTGTATGSKNFIYFVDSVNKILNSISPESFTDCGVRPVISISVNEL